MQRWFRSPVQAQAAREACTAPELHDTLFEGFLGMSLQIHEAVEQVRDDSSGKSSLSRTPGLMRRVIDTGREVLGLCCSRIDAFNVEPAHEGARERFGNRDKVRLCISVKGHPKTLDLAVQQQLYMIGREALLNALCHSRATSIDAEVEYSGRRVRVVVRDNGCGMDPQVVQSGRSAHWGLVGMRERAESIGAKLRIWSRLGGGTEVEISLHGGMMGNARA